MSQTKTNTNEYLPLWESLKVPLFLVSILWLIELWHSFGGLDVRGLGVYPRKLSGLWGVLTAPWVHADFAHVMSNSVPLLVLGTLIVHFYKKVAVPAIFLIYLLTGIAVWVLARQTSHIGASGIVYGMVAFVFWTGILTRNPVSIVLTLLVTFLYSGMFLGILPNQEGISWESHLFGAITGIYCAYLFRQDLTEEKDESEEEGKRFFLPRDTFSPKEMVDEEGTTYIQAPNWTSSQTWD